MSLCVAAKDQLKRRAAAAQRESGKPMTDSRFGSRLPCPAVKVPLGRTDGALQHSGHRCECVCVGAVKHFGPQSLVDLISH